MKKIKSKLTLAIMSLFLLLTTLSLNEIPVHAASSVTKGNNISGGATSSIYKNSPSWVWNLPGGMVYITVGGEIAYCLEPSRTVETTNASSVNFSSLTHINVEPASRPDTPKETVTKAMRDRIGLLVNHGFGYRGRNTVRYQSAT